MLRSLEQQTESHEKAPGSPSGRHFHLPLYAACLGLLVMAASLQGCSSNAPKAGADAPQKPAIPEEVLDATKSLLGSAAQVLLYGDLAKTGKQQLLAANVVPNTPKSTVAGLVVTRAVIAENEDGKWVELVRCDEHLKNAKGYLALTPLQAVSGWRLQGPHCDEHGGRSAARRGAREKGRQGLFVGEPAGPAAVSGTLQRRDCVGNVHRGADGVNRQSRAAGHGCYYGYADGKPRAV